MSLTNYKTSPFVRDEWFNNFFNDGFLNQKSVTKKTACNLSEDKDNYYCEIEAPGFKKEDLHISLDEGILTVSGQHEEKKCTKKSYHLEERFMSSFKRSFSLPKSVRSDKITAQYEAGVLKVLLPKESETQAKRILID